ncbi:MAG: cation:proton antiporter [Proteobacteria bacterium]|nr:cation:proton antiporter [Pseudomonadota bacterium]
MSVSILIFFGVLLALVFLLRVARVGALLAFLVAGVLAGPHVLDLFPLTDIWSFLGNIGVAFLWFTMGLEININRLWQMKRTIFGFGAAQVLVVVAMLFPILFGLTGWPILGTVMIALMLAMSSTSSDLGILADRNELQTQMGRQTFSILLFQDLMSVPLIAMLPLFAGYSLNVGANVIDILVMSVGFVIGAVVVGRWVLNPLMRYVTKLHSKEAFLLAVMMNIVLWAVAVGYVGLPPSLGAFLAGMLLSETVYRHQVSADIEPYRILFLSFFFIALGMGLDMGVLKQYWWIVTLGVIGLVGVKFVAIYIVARVRGVMTREAFLISLILAQGGEFGLLILQTLKSSGIHIIPLPDMEIIMAVIIVSMMMTPVLLAVYDRLDQSGKLVSPARMTRVNAEFGVMKKPAVIICGFGRFGQTIAKMLAAERIPYAAIDLNVDKVMMGKESGYNVFYGDTTKPVILQQFGLSPRGTRAVVVASDNTASAKRTIRATREVAKNVRIFARARTLNEANVLRAAGAKIALPETVESSFMLGEKVLLDIGIKQDAIDTLMAKMRENNYTALDNILDKND